ncbi:hypothetical protein HHK36_003095 [Tetracentron sinense]|uniref:NADH:ubiquinone oxidoreductase-like 20kDa subunit domain-containing protein n=1 Tax=Tetracentron sinense TaxID=13715 RepID=A0A834ZML6_TETSI|nr:hypothetical protein HHK36_003095 [Tetracentron sinense]
MAIQGFEALSSSFPQADFVESTSQFVVLNLLFRLAFSLSEVAPPTLLLGLVQSSMSAMFTVRRVDKLIIVDVYLPGCPPKPEAVMDAITKLRKKVEEDGCVAKIRHGETFADHLRYFEGL